MAQGFLLKKLIKIIIINLYQKMLFVLCGSKNKKFYITKTIPDFDINILSKKIAKSFT